jgi:hypothetical protein
MKKYTLAIGTAALAIFVTQQAAQATLTSVESGTATFEGSIPGAPLSVNYDVVTDGSTYTYLYSFTPLSGNPITQLTINANYVLSVLTSSTLISGDPGYLVLGGGTSITDSGAAGGGLAGWSWTVPGTTATQIVGFTSLFAPTTGTGTLIDGKVPSPWTDNPSAVPGATAIPVPVPEASTITAGALMLLPFGIGALRSLRRERRA